MITIRQIKNKLKHEKNIAVSYLAFLSNCDTENRFWLQAVISFKRSNENRKQPLPVSSY